MLAEVVRTAYQDVFTVVGDLSQASEDQLKVAFAAYEPASQQHRMVGLFLGLCQFSGLVPDRRPTGRPPRQRRVSTDSRTVHLRSGATVTVQVSGSLLHLSADDLEFVTELIRRIESYEVTSGNAIRLSWSYLTPRADWNAVVNRLEQLRAS